MGVYALVETGAESVAADDLLHGTPGQTLPVAVEKERVNPINRQLRSGFRKVPPEGLLSWCADKNHAFFVAFAAHKQGTFAEVEVAEIQAYDLAEADSGRVHELEDGAVAEALRGLLVGGLDERREMVFREDGGETALSFGCVHPGQWVGLAVAC